MAMSIGSGDERLDLAFSDTHQGSLVATRAGAGLEASQVVGPHYADDGFGDLGAFVADLERSWRGWHGPKSWSSLEGELSITAHHAGSHVTLRIDLRNAVFGHGAWAAQMELTVEAGEQLSSAAPDVRTLVSRPAAR